MLDRIDIHVEVASVSAQDLALLPPAEGTASVAEPVAQARDIQRRRYEGLSPRTSAEVEGELLDQVATPEPAGAKLLTEAASAMRLTACSRSPAPSPTWPADQLWRASISRKRRCTGA